MYRSRLSSRLTSGRSSTPRTTLKIAALAPMPSASVTTTVAASPFARVSERRAKRRSERKLIIGTVPSPACCHENTKPRNELLSHALGPPVERRSYSLGRQRILTQPHADRVEHRVGNGGGSGRDHFLARAG